MKAKALDGKLAGISDRISEGVESLLIGHVRVSFLKDAQHLKSIDQKIYHVQDNARAGELRLQKGAIRRLAALQVCLDRLVAEGEDVADEIRKLEKDRYNLQSFLDRGRSDRWSDSDRAAAKASADAALSDAALEIADCERLFDNALSHREQLSQEEHVCAARKTGSEELVSSLVSGREPRSYQDALAKEMDSITAAFQRSSEDLKRALIQRRDECLSAEAELSALRKEIGEARKRASQLETARNVDWLTRRLDPRNLLWRSSDAIQRDLAAQQDLVDAAQAAAADQEAQLDELGRQHEKRLAALPGAVRQRMIDEARRDVSDSSMRLTEIAQQSDQVSAILSAQRSDLASRKAHFTDEHQRYLNAHYADALHRAVRNLEKIHTCIAPATDRDLRGKQNCSRLSNLIERRRTRLDADLLNCQRQEKSQLDLIEREAYRLRLRLQDRASRADMVHDPITDAYREQDNLRNPTQNIRVSYRLTGNELSNVTSLPILLQRRAQTGYVRKDDERLAAVLASICREDEPREDDRPAFIDHFCDIAFGDDQDGRPFFISKISKKGESLAGRRVGLRGYH